MNELYSNFPSNALSGYWDWDMKTHQQYLSADFKKLLGYEEHDLPNNGDSLQQIVFAPDVPKLAAIFEKHISSKGQEPFYTEARYRHKEGHLVWITSHGRVVEWSAAGEPLRMVGIYMDVTRQKEAETKLRESEARFREAFEYSPIGMAIVSPEGKWIKVNRKICQITGYTEAVLLQMTFQDITHPDDLELDLEKLHKVLSGELVSYQIEKRYFHKNGSIVWVMLSVSLVRDEAGNPLHFVSQIEDITERKEISAALRKALEDMNILFSAMTHVSIIATDTAGIIKYFSKGAEKLLGYTAAEMIGKENPAIVHLPEEIEKKGKELSALYNTDVAGFDVFVKPTIETGYNSGEWTYVRKDGTRFPVQLVITLVRNAQDEVMGYVGVATDISNLKEVQEMLQHTLDLTSEQNKRLVNFAHIVSHNLRSHSGNLESLVNLVDDAEDEQERDMLMGYIKNVSVNLSETIVHLNEVVSIQTSLKQRVKEISLFKRVEKTCEIIQADIKDTGATIINDVPRELTVHYPDAYMDSILLNLLTNAIKYRDKDRPPMIRVAAYNENGAIVLQVTDNGIGIDLARYGDKLFGMYKTFHGNKDARGIGLFITKNQVEAFGGSIEVESELNKGTTFKIYLTKA